MFKISSDDLKQKIIITELIESVNENGDITIKEQEIKNCWAQVISLSNTTWIDFKRRDEINQHEVFIRFDLKIKKGQQVLFRDKKSTIRNVIHDYKTRKITKFIMEENPETDINIK